MKRTFTIVGTLVLVAALATVVALASVTFNPGTGTGFVGKGDVQIALGMNNAQLQAAASSLAFAYDSSTTYDAECYWETTTGRGTVIVHDITVPKHTSLNASVAYDARTRNQVTGFNLNGFGGSIVNGTAPAVGDPCPGGNPGNVISVTQTASSGTLSVNGAPLAQY